jgi:hypothetical protein
MVVIPLALGFLTIGLLDASRTSPSRPPREESVDASHVEVGEAVVAR